ncbi:dienelactone hydrolase family protein [Burkholderia pseudomallei]|nr:dienelactone hydrolase family protein [Burkholderia pseudomallei]
MTQKNPTAPFNCTSASRDVHVPLSVGQNVKAKHPQVEVFNYPADHGFACDAREQFDELSRDLAWCRFSPSISVDPRRVPLPCDQA